MIIDWFSFFMGVAVAILINNIVNVVFALLRYKRAKNELKNLDNQLSNFIKNLETSKKKILNKIKQQEGKKDDPHTS